MKRVPFARLTLVFALVLLGACSDRDLASWYRDHTLRGGDEVEGFNLGVMAYTWGITPVEMYRWLDLMVLDESHPRRRPFNVFYHDSQLAGPGYKGFDIPNNDTLYSYAWLDLREEPVVVSIGDAHSTYYSLQFIDFYSEVIAYRGSRDDVAGPRSFLLVGPGYRGVIPEGVDVIESPSSFTLLLARVLVEKPDAIGQAQAIQQGWQLQPLSWWERSEAYPGHTDDTLPRYSVEDAASYYRMLDTVVALQPPKPKDLPHWQALARIGLGSGQALDAQRPRVVKSFEQAFELAPKVLDKTIMEAGKEAGGGWAYSTKLGRYGGDYVQRSAVTAKGFGAHNPDEAVYYLAYFDETGAFLNGDAHYRIDFPAEPPVKGFWSLTLYERGSDSLVANPINRYKISPGIKGFSQNDDGSFSVKVGHSGDAEEGNWLPAPEGAFYLALRLYLPDETVLSGQWLPPPVTPQKN